MVSIIVDFGGPDKGALVPVAVANQHFAINAKDSTKGTKIQVQPQRRHGSSLKQWHNQFAKLSKSAQWCGGVLVVKCSSHRSTRLKMLPCVSATGALAFVPVEVLLLLSAAEYSCCYCYCYTRCCHRHSQVAKLLSCRVSLRHNVR
jgi:hypothetical protein